MTWQLFWIPASAGMNGVWFKVQCNNLGPTIIAGLMEGKTSPVRPRASGDPGPHDTTGQLSWIPAFAGMNGVWFKVQCNNLGPDNHAGLMEGKTSPVRPRASETGPHDMTWQLFSIPAFAGMNGVWFKVQCSNIRPDVHGPASCHAAEDEGGVARRIDPQPRAAPFEQQALAGHEVLDLADGSPPMWVSPKCSQNSCVPSASAMAQATACPL